jgi:hypothetical protein
MPDTKAVALIESQECLDPLADSVRKAVGGLFEAGGDTGRQVKNFLHGKSGAAFSANARNRRRLVGAAVFRPTLRSKSLS